MYKLRKTPIFVMFLILDITIFFFVHKYLPFELHDILYLLLFIGCIEFCLLVPSSTDIDSELIIKINGIHKIAYIRKNAWLKSNLIWMTIHYWIIAASFLATLIVIYITVDNLNKNSIVFYSVVSLFSSIMSYILSPMTIAKGYRLAYQEIDKAIFQYENSKDKNTEILSFALMKGEEYIKKYCYEMK